MERFIKSILTFSLANKYFILLMTALIVAGGIISYVNTPIEAFPDVTNTQIKIVTQWPGRSAEEVEKLVTIPIEIQMNSVQKKTNLRSITLFGLSVITLIFEDDVDDAYARQQVNNLLRNVQLPEGVEADVQPPYGPTGEIFRYTLESPSRTIRELKTIQDWTVDRQLRSVSGIADVVSFGGEVKTYEISVNPNLLNKYGITSLDVFEAVSKSNINVGGDVIEKSAQAYVVRGIGLLNNIQEIENIIVDNINGTPILVKNVAEVKESFVPKLGQVGRDKKSDVVEGIVVMRKGENPGEVLDRLKEKIEEINKTILPPDVKMVTFYDRSNLINFCTHTVIHNLLEGIILVTVIVFLFMADWRTTLIVSIIIPLALLFAFICMRLKGMTANLLSMGAVDFGIIIDGAVVMVEGVFVALDHKAHKIGMPAFNKRSKLGLIRITGMEMGKAIFFAKLIIITCLIPIFAFQKVEGKMFSPLAYTLGFALLGALMFTLTLVPVLCSMLLKKDVKEKHNKLLEIITLAFTRLFDRGFRNRKVTLILSFLVLLISLFVFNFLGTEFLPSLNEGALWVEAQAPMSISLTEARQLSDSMRTILQKFPEVKQVLSQTGRSNDGTDPSGFFNVQCQVDLYPKEEWKNKRSTESLILSMDSQLTRFPGVIYNYSQPIIDNVQEAVAGINASLAVKIFGNDFKTLDRNADSVYAVLKTVKGVEDLGILRNIGQPEVRIELDQKKMAFYGVTTAYCNAVIEMAIGGKAATQLYEGEKKFDIRIRYQEPFRTTEDEIANLRVPTIHGTRIPLKEIADIKLITGPAFVFRDNNRRFIAVKFSVRGRDLGSTIAEAQKKVNKALHIPYGYQITWNGEFENQVRATKRLTQVVPISLLLIFLILFVTFGTIKDALLVLFNVPFALIGGIFALWITNTIFSISAGIGFIALFGVCIQNGVILISVFKKNLHDGQNLKDSIRNGVISRIRPVVMTALMAAIGLLPAAISTGIGSETQKPLAIVVIGGLISATVLVMLVLPSLFYSLYRLKHE